MDYEHPRSGQSFFGTFKFDEFIFKKSIKRDSFFNPFRISIQTSNIAFFAFFGKKV